MECLCESAWTWLSLKTPLHTMEKGMGEMGETSLFLVLWHRSKVTSHSQKC
uniref:Uncharacterized protein n=1 Tax=Anguilla anguilla TaxID=7936 RepID=A0A0E9WZ53_ANGAN